MKNFLTFLFCFNLFLSGYGQEIKYKSLRQMDWLVGHWQGLYKGAPFYESWIKVNDSLLVNLAIEIKGKDTLVKENGFIRLQKEHIIHGGTNATWRLSKLNDNEMVFENDTSKFANRIIWSHTPNDHWLAEIHNPGGIIRYDLKRVPWLGEFVNRFLIKTQKRSNN